MKKTKKYYSWKKKYKQKKLARFDIDLAYDVDSFENFTHNTKSNKKNLCMCGETTSSKNKNIHINNILLMCYDDCVEYVPCKKKPGYYY